MVRSHHVVSTYRVRGDEGRHNPLQGFFLSFGRRLSQPFLTSQGSITARVPIESNKDGSHGVSSWFPQRLRPQPLKKQHTPQVGQPIHHGARGFGRRLSAQASAEGGAWGLGGLGGLRIQGAGHDSESTGNHQSWDTGHVGGLLVEV